MHTVFIGMGANLASTAGPPEVTLAEAALRLESLGQVLCRSSLYSTEPVGYAAQPRFVNAVVVIETDLEPLPLLDGLLRIEQEFGRDRSAGIQNGPRTLDLDILLFGDRIVSEPGLEIPHPRITEREFVIVPLREIASNCIKVCHGTIVKQLLNAPLTLSHGDTNDAVLPFQSPVWRAGVCRDPHHPTNS